MDSEHNSSSCDDLDCKLCDNMGSTWEDSSSQMAESKTDILNNNPDSHQYQGNESNVSQNLHFCDNMGSSMEDSSSQMAESKPDILSNNPDSHQYQDNESNMSPNLHFSSNEPPSTECNPSKDCQPAVEISNTLASSLQLNYESSEIKSIVLQDKEKPFCETQYSGNQDVHLQPNDSPGTELRSTENENSQCTQPSQIEGLKASETVPSISPHLFTERQQRPSSRCHLIQETQYQTLSGPYCEYQDLGPSPQQLSGSYMNRVERLDSASEQQYRHAQFMSRSTHPVLINQPHYTTAAQESSMLQPYCYGNEFTDQLVPNISYFRYTPRPSRIQDLHLPPFQQSARRFNYNQSSHRQRFPQYKSSQSSIQGPISQRLQHSESNTKAIHVDSKNDSNIHKQHYPMSSATKESNVNQDLRPQQPTESRALVAQGFHQVPQVSKVSNSTVRHLPYSLPQQQSNQRPRAVQPVEKVHNTSQDIRLQQDSNLPNELRDRFLVMCVNQNMPSSQDQVPPHYDLSDLQCPYSNRAEVMNILVYGPTGWTSRLIQKYSRGLQLSFVSPYSHALTRNVTRGGIVTSVSVYQVEDLMKSVGFMRSCCHSAKSTVMFVFTLSDQGVEEFLNIVRRRVSRNVPITFVGCRHKEAGNKVLRLIKTGYMLKSRYDLSAFLECKADSEEDVDSVFYNAIDVALLRRT